MLSGPTVLIPDVSRIGYVIGLPYRGDKGSKESLIHLLMYAEVGGPLLAAMFVDALIVAARDLFVHEATSLWDVSYATTARSVTPIEQHVHSVLEMIPLIAILRVVPFLAVFGAGPERRAIRSRLEIGAIAHRLYRLGLGGGSVLRVLCRLISAGLRANAGHLPARNARGQTTLR